MVAINSNMENDISFALTYKVQLERNRFVDNDNDIKMIDKNRCFITFLLLYIT